MSAVKAVFERGPQAILELFATLPPRAWDDMDIKELADISWTRASTLVKKEPGAARLWGHAALAGYEYLGRHGHAAAAESASENAAALRSWRLLSDQSAA